MLTINQKAAKLTIEAFEIKGYRNQSMRFKICRENEYVCEILIYDRKHKTTYHLADYLFYNMSEFYEIVRRHAVSYCGFNCLKSNESKYYVIFTLLEEYKRGFNS